MKKHSKQQEQLNLLLSQEDIPANHFQLQERERVKTTLETSGQKCLDLSRNSNLYGFLQKMLKDTSNWAWTKYYMTWKAKTTPHKHLLFQLLVSVRTTKGKGYGLWATPNTMDHLPPREKEDCSSNQKNRKKQISIWESEGTSSASGDVAHSPSSRSSFGLSKERHRKKGNTKKFINNYYRNGGRKRKDNWATEPNVGRVVDGIQPFRVDRIRALGNSIVPQIAEIIGKAIISHEEQKWNKNTEK